MPILAPPTRSVGKVRVIYGNSKITHRCGVNLSNSAIPTPAGVGADALLFAEALMGCITALESSPGYEITDPDGIILYRVNWPAPIVGSHGGTPGQNAYYSTSLSIPGRGVPVSPGGGSGNTLIRFFCRNAYPTAIGDKNLPASAYDTPLEDLILFISANSILYADFYGQPAVAAGNVPVQFNAGVQRRYGT